MRQYNILKETPTYEVLQNILYDYSFDAASEVGNFKLSDAAIERYIKKAIAAFISPIYNLNYFIYKDKLVELKNTKDFKFDIITHGNRWLCVLSHKRNATRVPVFYLYNTVTYKKSTLFQLDSYHKKVAYMSFNNVELTSTKKITVYNYVSNAKMHISADFVSNGNSAYETVKLYTLQLINNYIRLFKTDVFEKNNCYSEVIKITDKIEYEIYHTEKYNTKRKHKFSENNKDKMKILALLSGYDVDYVDISENEYQYIMKEYAKFKKYCAIYKKRKNVKKDN